MDAPPIDAAAPPSLSQAAAPPLDLLMRSSDSVYAVLSLDAATILYISPNVARVFGREPSRVVGCACAARASPRRAGAREAALWRRAMRVVRALPCVTRAELTRPVTRRRSLVDCIMPANRATVAALVAAVQHAPPHSPPCTARMQRVSQHTAPTGEQLLVWAEMKLYRSDVRALLHARRTLAARGAAARTSELVRVVACLHVAASGSRDPPRPRRASAQGEVIYGVARDISDEMRVSETLRDFLLTTR
jgi:hypothetical protein